MSTCETSDPAMMNRKDVEGHMIEMKTASPRTLHRLGVVMEPDPADLREAEGVLNPAVTRGPDGQLYLLPRVVAPGNYSRIGLASVHFNQAGDPVGVERLEDQRLVWRWGV